MKSFEQQWAKIAEAEPKYNFEQIKALELSAVSLVSQLKEKIDGDEYDMLIGDDASGRIPTLVLRSVINERKRHLRADKSPKENEIATKFIAGGQTRKVNNTEEVVKFLEKIKSQIKKKALLVTEYMNSGKGMDKMAEAFNRTGIDFDVATFASFKDPDFYQKNCDNLSGHEIFAGGKGFEHVMSIYGKNGLAGVEKDDGGRDDPHRDAHTIASKGHYERARPVNQRNINRAREDIKILTDEVVKKVWE